MASKQPQRGRKKGKNEKGSIAVHHLPQTKISTKNQQFIQNRSWRLLFRSWSLIFLWRDCYVSVWCMHSNYDVREIVYIVFYIFM